MCVFSIELVWVEIYEKMGEKSPFLGIFEVWYRYQIVWYRYRIVWYRYHMCSGQLVQVPKSQYRYPMLCFGLVLVVWP